MRFRHLILTVCLSLTPFLLACSATGGGAATSAAVPDVREGGLEEAIALARLTDRNILVAYTSRNCSAYRKMEHRALSDARVKSGLKSVVYVRLVKGQNAALFEERYGERDTPTFLVLDSEGRPAGNLVTGGIATTDFVRYVAWAKTIVGPEPEFASGGT
jgi:hypothetical protein